MRSFLLAIAALAACCGYHPSDPLIVAVLQGDARRVSALLDGGTDVNVRDHYSSALVAAARSGHVALAGVLIAHGADPNLPAGVNGWTPLMHAIHKDQIDSVRALLEGGADVNRKSHNGLNALIMAAGYGYDDIVRLLLNRGADAYAEKADGVNALTAAVGGVFDIDRLTAGACQTGTVETLLDHAPDLQLSDNIRARKALASARANHCTSVLRLLGQK